jgi:hypothetical protein
MTLRAIWDIVPCSLGVYRRFRGEYCLHQTTWYDIREGSHLHTHCCENLKSLTQDINGLNKTPNMYAYVTYPLDLYCQIDFCQFPQE